MVHALEQIHKLLMPGGCLINIQPDGEKVQFFAEIDGEEQFIGLMEESDDYIEYFQASDAMQTSVEQDLFRVERSMAFEFRSYADSFDELKTHLDENWSDAVVTEEVIATAKELESKFGEYKTILHEQVLIGLYQALG